MLLADIVEHLQYPPIEAFDIEYDSQDLTLGQIFGMLASIVNLPPANIGNSVSLPNDGIPFRYLRKRPSPDSIRVTTRVASPKPASKVHGISMS